jgi:ribosomal protein L11 methyltransferase
MVLVEKTQRSFCCWQIRCLKHVSSSVNRGESLMAYELMISFKSPDLSSRAQTKKRVTSWLEAIGRSDYVEGIIDGVDTQLTDEEEATGQTTEVRLETSPLALFDDAKPVCDSLARDLMKEFGDDIRCVINEITDESWQHCWREDFTPLTTQKFYITPLGDPTTTPPGLGRVEIDARGEAFGTGQHATTRAIISVLEQHLRDWGVKSVLDIGTGTGLYLILSKMLGATLLTGTEISGELVSLARANCEIAGVTANIVLCERPHFPDTYDLVIANILVPVLHDLMADMAQHLNPDGRLILGGFVTKEQASITHRAQACGLRVETTTDELGWKCLILRRAQDFK